MLLSLVGQARERRLAELPGHLRRRREDGGPQRRGGHHVHRPGEPGLRQDLPRRRHQEYQSDTGLLHEGGDGFEGPGFDRARRHATPSAAFSSSRRTRPAFTPGSATATMSMPDRAGTTRSAPRSACRCQKTSLPTPPASMARPSRVARLAASAATAAPLMPSIRLSATTRPSPPATTIAPRTPRTLVMPRSADSYPLALTAAAPATGARAVTPAARSRPVFPSGRCGH